MENITLHQIFFLVQHLISFVGILVIFSGVVISLYQYACYVLRDRLTNVTYSMNSIRLNLGKVLILGLEFIVAADLIGTTTTPDYYSVGILACIVLIRTFLSYSLNKEMMSLTSEEQNAS